jgi:hypothetical protein
MYSGRIDDLFYSLTIYQPSILSSLSHTLSFNTYHPLPKMPEQKKIDRQRDGAEIRIRKIFF